MNHFIEHFRLDVEILGDRTRETWYHSDPENGIRRQRVIEEWAGRKRIGVGAGGEVFREYSDRGGVRAIKAIRKPENSDLSGFIKELVAMGHLSKDNDLFVELYGWYQCDQFLYLAMEYLELGHITMCYEDCMSESDVRVVAKQLLEGVARMHEKDIIHRDLKPQNILVYKKDPIWIKIADFGSSKVIQKNEPGASSFVGTADFAAPEVLQLLDNAPETLEYTNAVDIWSVGCVLYYILTRELPFPRGKLWDYCKARKPQFPVHLLQDKNVSFEGISLIQNLMSREPSERMSASDALVTQWITNEVILQEAAEASDTYHWQPDLQVFPYQETDGYFEQPRRSSHQQTAPISTFQHASSDYPTVNPAYYHINRSIVPIVPPKEYNPWSRPTDPLPHSYYRRHRRVPPAEQNSARSLTISLPRSHNRHLHIVLPAGNNSVSRQTVRGHEQDGTAVMGDTVHHHSFQQEGTMPTLDYPDQEADWERVLDDNSHYGARSLSDGNFECGERSPTDDKHEFWEQPKNHSWTEYLGSDTKNHHGAELPRYTASSSDNDMPDCFSKLSPFDEHRCRHLVRRQLTDPEFYNSPHLFDTQTTQSPGAERYH